MRIERMNTWLIVWLLALSVGGVLGGFGVVGWTLVAALALFPAIVVRRLQSGPAATLSERIQAARR